MATTTTSPSEKNVYIPLFDDFLDQFAELDDAEFGRVVRAALHFNRGDIDTIESLPKLERVAFNSMWSQMERTLEKTKKRCEVNRANGALGGRPKKQENQTKPIGFSEKPKNHNNRNNNENRNNNDKHSGGGEFTPPPPPECAYGVHKYPDQDKCYKIKTTGGRIIRVDCKPNGDEIEPQPVSVEKVNWIR